MADDLVGGFTVGAKADYERDVAQEEIRPGARVPLRVHLASGSDRKVTLTVRRGVETSERPFGAGIRGRTRTPAA